MASSRITFVRYSVIVAAIYFVVLLFPVLFVGGVGLPVGESSLRLWLLPLAGMAISILVTTVTSQRRCAFARGSAGNVGRHKWKRDMRSRSSIGVWTAIGSGIGAAVGSALDQIPLSVAIGAAIGVAVGLQISKRSRLSG